jgi:hypothetical protein
MVGALASFDALQISESIGVASQSGAAPAEVHAFAYLGCLLSVYDRRPSAEWGYQFHATPAGAPFAPALDEALKILRASGLLVLQEDTFVLSSVGREDLNALGTHSVNSARLRYLKSATATAVLMPLPMVTNALSREPQLQRILGAPSSRTLLDTAGVDVVNSHFRIISEGFDERKVSDSDLTLPAMVWLSALAAVEDTYG